MKRIVAIVFAILAVGVMSHAADTAWPERPLEMICPGNPGGDTDLYQRIYCKYLEQELGQPIVIINMAGAGGSIATNNVHQAKPDGYRALFFHSGVLVNRLMEFIDYDIWDAFEIAAIPVMDRSNCFVVSAKSAYTTIPELVAFAKEHPEEVTFATEIGSYSSLQSLAFEDAAGIRFNIVDGGTSSEKLWSAFWAAAWTLSTASTA